MLADAVTTARDTDSRVEVDTELVVGDPATALLRAAETAGLLVVGNQGVGGFGGLLLGSTGVSASARATPARSWWSEETSTAVCPMAAPHLWSSGSTAPRPRRRCCRLRSTRRPADEHRCCSCTPGRCLCTGVISTPAATRPRPRRIAAGERSCVAPRNGVQREHPALSVRCRIGARSAGAELVGASQEARLVVVGSSGAGPLTGLLLGSTTHAVIHHAACPVLVHRGA